MAEEYLNFWDALVNQVSGSEMIFLILSIIFIAYAAAKFRFPNQIILMILGLWVLLISYFIPILFPLALFAIAVFVGIEILKLTKDR